MEIKILDITKKPIEKLAYIAKISHRSHETSKKSDTELLKDIIRWGHLSVLEHAYATIEINGISRACSHQLVRHRHFSFLQESQRYVDMSDTNFCIPASLINDNTIYNTYTELLKKSLSVYKQLLDSGITKEDARMVLPNATSTRIVVSGNFRTWREFIHKREIKAAQEEIRIIAQNIKKILSDATESFFWKFEI